MRRLMVTTALFAATLAGLANACAADKDDESPKVAATRKLLKTKISVDFKDALLRDVVTDIQDQIKEQANKKLSVLIDTKGGVSLNTKFTYKADKKPLEEVLDELLKKNDLGYIIVTKGAYPGALQIVKGKARGYPEKKEDK